MWHRIADGLTMLAVSAMALLLLVYLGYGEAHQRFARYILTGATTQGEIIRGTVETSLRNGVTITQLAGFGTIAKPIIDAENGVAGIRLVDRTGATVFSADEGESINGRSVLAARGRGSSDARGAIDHVRDSAHLVVVMPIHDRFETVGHLLVSVPRGLIDTRVRNAFVPPILLAMGLSFFFALSAALLSQEMRRSWLTTGYVVVFVAAASMVTWTMISLYSQGVAAKTDASAESLAHRLKDIPGFNLNFDQFDDVDAVFSEYRRLDPDISATALIVNGIVAIHTTPGMVGRRWVKDEYSFEHWSDISNPAASANRIMIAVSVPRQLVVREVAGSIRDFAALLVASGFFAALFFRFAGIMSDRVGAPAMSSEHRVTERGLALARPLFFLAVFVEHLNYPFMPQYVLELIQGVGQRPSLSAAPFAGYYLAFALSLVPGGWLCRRLGTKRLVSWGLCLAGLGLALLPIAEGAAGLTLSRVVAGTGQGLLFIGIQSYVIAQSDSARRTQGAAIIVFGFQGGMISGTAIGSLLVEYIGPSGVFLLSAAVAAVVLLYAVVLLPGDADTRSPPAPGTSGIGGLFRVFKPEFLATMLLIGIPAKAVMTGVVLFGLPLLLAGRGFSSGAIGQLIMLYGLAVLAASEWIARVIDRSGATRQSLFWGAVLGGIGLVIIGSMRPPALAGGSPGDVVLLLTGILVLGAAHGLINAPIVTAISESDAARLLGVDHVTAAYRLLERIGHVLGPLLVTRIFAHAGHDGLAFVWIGVVVLILGLAYMACVAAGLSRSKGATAP